MSKRIRRSIAALISSVLVLSMAFQSLAAIKSYVKPENMAGGAVADPVKVTGTWTADAQGNWFFASPDGAAKDGWYYLNTTNKATEYNWFCFDANGVMRTGWIQDKSDPSVWYYTGETKDSSEGGMVKGWATDPRDGKRYYMDLSTGIMRYGWQLIGNVWYYFGEKQYSNASHPYGAMYVNEKTPDGYYVGSNGGWIQNHSENDSDDPVGPVVVPITGVSLDKSEVTLVVGDTCTLNAAVAPANATNKNVKWSSSDSTVATVDAAGKVTAVAAGTAVITVTTVDGGKTATCTVTVKPATETKTIADILGTVSGGFPEEQNAWVADTGYKCFINDTSSELRFRNTSGYGYDIGVSEPVTKDGDNYVYEANWAKISFTMDSDSLISITWYSSDTGYRDYNGTYAPPAPVVPVTGVSIGQSSLELSVGEEKTFSATVLPENATNKNVTWSSNKPEVATVDNEGKVTAVAAGEATITVTTVDGGKTATCTVTVTAPATWGVIGDFSEWVDVPMTETETNVFVSPAIALTTSNSFIVRYGADWETRYGAPCEGTDPYVITSGTPITATSNGYDMAVPTNGDYFVTLNLNGEPYTITVTVQTPETKTVAQILATVEDFPTSNEKAWIGNNPMNSCYINGDNLRIGGIKAISLPLTTDVSGSGDNFTCSYNSVTFTFNMTEGKLTSIEVNGSGEGSFDDTYEPATPAPTINNIADVLATVEGFPTSDSQNPPTNAWVDANENKCYVYDEMLNFYKDQENSYSMSTSLNVTEKPGSNYVYEDSSVSITFAMDNGKLKRIEVAGDQDHQYCVGTYAPAATTVPVTSVSLDPNTLELPVDGDQTLSATVLPENATNKNVTWSSNNTNVATVDNEGKVTAVAAGEATITVTTEDGSKTATCTVTVTAPAPETKTVEEILATVVDFPTSDSQNPPTNAWVTGDNKTCFVNDDYLDFRCGENISGISTSDSVSQNGNTYVYTDTTSTITFTMDEGKLISITFSDDTYSQYNGTYAPAAPASTYTVTFDMQEHGTQINPFTNVTSGSTISAPTAPAEDGYTFGGWYKEAACTHVWNFDTDTVTANTTLYAKWEENTPTVAVTGISVNPSNLNLTTGDGIVTVTIMPENATNKEFTVEIEGNGFRYTIEKNRVSFSKNGIGNNSATATIKSKDGEFRATVRLQKLI